MANTNEQVAAEALIMLHNSETVKEAPKPKHTFIVPVLKSTPVVPAPKPNTPSPIKRKRASPSTPNLRNKGRFAKKESLFIPKPPKKAYTGTIT